MDYYITGLPRSGTAWASLFFSGGNMHTFHDLLGTYHYEDLPKLREQTDHDFVGVADTGLWCFHEWLNAQGKPVVILERPYWEVNASLGRMGLPALAPRAVAALHKVEGLRVPYWHLWDETGIKAITDYLFDDLLEVSWPWWQHLRMMRVTRRLDSVDPDPAIIDRLKAEANA